MAGSVSCPGSSKWRDCSAATSSTKQCYNRTGYDVFIAQVDVISEDRPKSGPGAKSLVCPFRGKIVGCFHGCSGFHH